MLFGGTNERAVKDITVEASPYSERLRLSYDASSRNYTFEGWTEEVMIAPRVMPDSVLLPNGKVVVLNGGGVGPVERGAGMSGWMHASWGLGPHAQCEPHL